MTRGRAKGDVEMGGIYVRSVDRLLAKELKGLVGNADPFEIVGDSAGVVLGRTYSVRLLSPIVDGSQARSLACARLLVRRYVKFERVAEIDAKELKRLRRAVLSLMSFYSKKCGRPEARIGLAAMRMDLEELSWPLREYEVSARVLHKTRGPTPHVLAKQLYECLRLGGYSHARTKAWFSEAARLGRKENAVVGKARRKKSLKN